MTSRSRGGNCPIDDWTIGNLICKQSDEALVDLTLPKDANIYAKEYKLYPPDKKLLQKNYRNGLMKPTKKRYIDPLRQQ